MVASDHHQSDQSDSLNQLIINRKRIKKRIKKRKLIAIISLSVPWLVQMQRKDPYYRQKMCWDDHVAELNNVSPMAFFKGYRMTYHSFIKLADLLAPFINVKTKNSPNTEGIVTNVIQLHCAIRWLSGCNWWANCCIAGISKASFYRCCHRVIRAINACPNLSYNFPTTEQQLQEATAGFRGISQQHIMDGCVGALDGILIKTKQPTRTETSHVTSFFSGHYRHYGINIQAMSDHKCRFIYFSAAAPGGSNDGVAHRDSSLPGLLDNLPFSHFCVADNAYTCTETLLTPFSGSQKLDPTKDAYSFFLSQCRIHVEMMFGRLVSKWRILKKPLECTLNNNTRIVYACSRLHNYIINDGDFLSEKEHKANQHHLPTPYYIRNGRPRAARRCAFRTKIVEEIKDRNMERPAYNKQRNNGSNGSN